jgi:carboxypeptidase Taq
MTGTSIPSDDPTLSLTLDNPDLKELTAYTRESADLGSLAALAGWDQETAMPPGGAEARGRQSAAIGALLHERQTAPQIREWLDRLEPRVAASPFTDADRGMVREVRRDYETSVKLPTALVRELAEVGAAAFEAWRRAREHNAFQEFAPLLKRMVTLQREVADRLGYPEQRYDALLDLYEPGLTYRQAAPLLARAREASIDVLQRIRSSGHPADNSLLRGHFGTEQQLRVCNDALRSIGYDFQRGVLAQSAHPFTTGIASPSDVRLTVRVQEQLLSAAVMAALHEGGHGLYEQNLPAALAGTPVGRVVSLGAHESQSRLWENAIGRSEAYWRYQLPALRAVFPDQLRDVEPAAFARALCQVQPSLIRVEADEVTYNLHIIVRFELEAALIGGDIEVDDLPALWNERYEQYLGVRPERDADGVLQDIHWSHGSYGYFPTYTLGNLYAAQIYSAIRRAFPDFDARLASDGPRFILDWLREHMYRYAAVYTPAELIERVTGEPPNPEYFARYLRERYNWVYQLSDRTS